jgi:hypothetical protein
MALGSIQSLTEISTRNILGGNGRPARRADNLTAIYEPIVWILFYFSFLQAFFSLLLFLLPCFPRLLSLFVSITRRMPYEYIMFVVRISDS